MYRAVCIVLFSCSHGSLPAYTDVLIDGDFVPTKFKSPYEVSIYKGMAITSTPPFFKETLQEGYLLIVSLSVD